MNKTSGRRLTFEVTVTGKGLVGFKWDPNQALEGKCHAAADYMNEGAAVKRVTWEDRGKAGGPPDHTRENAQQQHQTT